LVSKPTSEKQPLCHLNSSEVDMRQATLRKSTFGDSFCLRISRSLMEVTSDNQLLTKVDFRMWVYEDWLWMSHWLRKWRWLTKVDFKKWILWSIATKVDFQNSIIYRSRLQFLVQFSCTASCTFILI